MAYRHPPTKTYFRNLAPEPKSQAEVKEQFDDMLKSLGERVLGVLSTGRDKFYDFDDKYAARVRQGLGPDEVLRGITSGMPIRETVGDPANMTANIMSRYALPAGGLTLAGVGLADLTNGLYNAAAQVPLIDTER